MHVSRVYNPGMQAGGMIVYEGMGPCGVSVMVQCVTGALQVPCVAVRYRCAVRCSCLACGSGAREGRHLSTLPGLGLVDHRCNRGLEAWV